MKQVVAVIGVAFVLLVAFLAGVPEWVLVMGIAVGWPLVAFKISFDYAANRVEAILFGLMLCSPVWLLAVLGLQWRYRQFRRHTARASVGQN